MEHSVFYRKYRPQTFEEVRGQEHITESLKRDLEEHRISHAYLFSGPRGTGKTSVARILARAVNCEKDPGPCNKCEVCSDFSSGRTLDLIEIDAASNRGIDDIRAIKEQVLLMPSKGRRKVYIVDEAHMMTKDAFNAFLKTLEEPPEHAMFIMATTEPEKMPETIISRTQHFKFRPLSEKLIAETLKEVSKKEGIILKDEAAILLAFLSEGSLRDAMNYLTQVRSLGGKEVGEDEIRKAFGVPSVHLAQRLMDSIFKKDLPRAIENISEIEKAGASADLFLKMLIRNYRFLFLSKISSSFTVKMKEMVGERDYDYFLEKLDGVNAEDIQNSLVTLLQTANERYAGPHQTLPLELAVSKIISGK
ncbi:MAG: hypothetical protein COU46_01050 [Candidatus Niyogibacteria bacterium CG10_big_fil_rev_8_21_14_0_10_42_19]|uniref:DNA polymerase III subunit gamma/tau n=1 Tax=Candidatus Niyogibacteria bacterium CG10_big_fil_rev_8_21_14_0_10_42_19 TaxID=1974725 RepID=A0A2H0TG18_9BACT|nr:MAG: hypothetical protein COU46_01050 [Candidatus Niyogibacteria bacterium CG10_big_fil_rev_8_21_14_0_10_42_19]